MRRGDIFSLKSRRHAEGHEQVGPRFAVIVQSDAMQPWSVVIAAPTSRGARAASFRPVIRLRGEETRVLTDQLAALDTGRFAKCVGHVSLEEQWLIDECLREVLGLVF